MADGGSTLKKCFFAGNNHKGTDGQPIAVLCAPDLKAGFVNTDGRLAVAELCVTLFFDCLLEW